MFHWICPECGREIPPKLKECPSCDPQSAPVAHAPEAVVSGAAEAATQQPAPVENVAADGAAAAAADSPVLTLREIAMPVESGVATSNTLAEPAAIQSAIAAAKTIEPADPVSQASTEPAVTNKTAAVEPETARASVEAAATPVAAGHAESGDETPAPSVAEASPESVPDTPTEIAASAHSTPAAAQLELLVAGRSAEPAAAQQVPPTEQPDFTAAGRAEPLAELVVTQHLAIPPLAIRPLDAAEPEFPKRQAQLPLSPVPSPDPARDPLLALAEQIREAQAQAASLSTEPEPPPLPGEPVPSAITTTPTVTSEPPSRANPDEAATEEIFLPPVLARLAASIGVSEPRPTAPEPVSPRSEHDASHKTELVAEPVAQYSPAAASNSGALEPRTTLPLELTSRHIECISPVESSLQIESAHTQVESAHAHIDSEHAHSGQLALLTDAPPLALLANAVISAPPEAAPAPLETAVIQAPPEPGASTAQTVTQLVPPQLPIADLAAPDDSSSGKAPSGSWLQLAPLQDYSAATAHSMQPVPLAAKILTPDSGPRMTLPGPTLPPELARFQNANLVTVIGDASRTGRFRMPGWAVSFLVMLALLVIGVAVVFYFLPVAHSNAETQAPAVDGHAIAPQPATPTLASQPAAHPLAQFVEVTGFRIVVDFNKKSEIHYLVVNHSSADLSDVTVYVTLRTASAKPGQPPLCRFSFRAPSLGPFESKEMTSSIEKLNRSITLPDWQDLRPEVQIAQ